MKHDELKELVAGFSLGALDPDEKREFEAHLSEGCSQCEANLAEIGGVTNSLPFAAPPEFSPPDVKEKLMAAIAEEKPPLLEKVEDLGSEMLDRLRASRRRWQIAAWSLGFASVVLAVAWTWYSSDLKSDMSKLESRVEIDAELIRQLEADLQARERILKIMQSPQLKFAELNGLDPSPDAKGKVVWDPEQQQAVFYGSNLTAIPTDKDYQLWILKGNEPISAAVFTPDEEGKTVSEFETISEDETITAFAVTLEPKGGVPAPSGDMYLIGTL